ncbi:DsbE family thiol:disulfide interchange protein [Pseudoroseicyclus sp. CXY001]|uniref:DsbE family thiol:disulfide interchange protein n=1 Tax=Pseudoroseicyclus sp. CXY001 TaxID=3242492 RepID=UPI00358DCD2F
MARLSPLVILPPAIFAAIAGLFLGGMVVNRDDALPSTLIGRAAPPLPVEALPGKPALTDEMLRSGELTIVNFWASWCPPCRLEHPTLMALAAEGYRVAGVNFRDEEPAAQGYLEDEGDPFFASAFDPRGRTAVDWGVTAPPETFLVDGEGEVLFRFVGPLIGAAYEQQFLPALEEASAGMAAE